MFKKFITTTTLALAVFTCINAQDSAKTSAFRLSGSADAYYRYNFHNNKSSKYNNLTSFTNSQNSFELGMASLKAEHSIGKVGMVADLGFGKRAEEFSYNDDKTMLAIKQLYVTYAPSSKVKLTMGSWGTHVGYELVDAYLNRNYSMSYMFSYGPFFHTGIKAEFGLGDKSQLMVGITNPTDLKSAIGLPKMVVAQFATGTKDDKLKAYINYQGGNSDDSARLMQGDVVVTYAVSPKFSIGYNGTIQNRQAKSQVKDEWIDGSSWWGSALYLNADPTSWFGLTLRGEYLSDKKSVLGFSGDESGSGAFKGSIFETTLSANFKIDNLTIIPELRLDNGSTTGLFYKHNGTNTKSTAGFLLAAVYHF